MEIDPSVFAALPRDIQDELLAAAKAPSAAAEETPPDAWSCRVCTFLNHPELAECELCGALCVALDDEILQDAESESKSDSERGSDSRLGRTLRRLKLPATPATVSFSHKRDPTAEDLLVAATSRFQAAKASWKGRRSRANSTVGLPSMQAMRELAELQKDLTHKVLAGDSWFESSLERLWRAVDDQDRPFDRKTVNWVELGFQNESPETDFRGGGVLALKCLMYAFEAHPNEMRRIHRLQRPEESKRWYPVCVAGINLTCLLAGLLQLGDGRFAERNEVFWPLFEEPAAFYELFYLAFIKMDAIWHRLNATYMEFGVVLKVTRKSVVFVLEQAPATLMDLRNASDQAFLDRFVVSLSAHSLADWEGGECPDPYHALETEDALVITKARATSKAGTTTKSDAGAEQDGVTLGSIYGEDKHRAIPGVTNEIAVLAMAAGASSSHGGGSKHSENKENVGESKVREGNAVAAPAIPSVLKTRQSWVDRAKAVIVPQTDSQSIGTWAKQWRRQRRLGQHGPTRLRPIEISATVAVVGRCVVAPLLLLFIFGATSYLTQAKFFIGPADSYFAYSQLDPVMHGGCSGCICSCRKVLMQLSAFGTDAVMSKPAYEDLQAIATEAVAAGDYSRLTPEALALADQLDADGAVCSTGVNDWDTPNVVLASGPEGVLAVITTLRLSLSPQMLRELEVAVERKDECVSRWDIGILLRLFKFQNVRNSLDYSSVPAADVITFPHYTDCRPDIPNEGIVGEKLAHATDGEDLLAVVPDILKLFPYQFTSSLPQISRYLPAKNTIYNVKNVTQPLFKGYYAGCRVRVVNTTGVYVEDTCSLLKHWHKYGLMIQAPDDLPVCSSGGVCVHNQYNSEWEYTNDVNPNDPTRLDQIISVFRSRYADTVSLSILPGVVVVQILFMGIVSLYQVMSHQRSVLLTQVWAYRCQNGRMQPIYLVQISYHLAFNSNSYYLGLSTGTLSMASIVNLTLSFFAFNYSFINLVRARSGEQVLDRHFRIPWEILQLTSTICAFGVLTSLRSTSLAFIGEMNGELLRRTSVRGAKYCGLKDSCYVFTVNLVFVVASVSFAMGFVANLGALIEKRITRKMQLALRRGATIDITPRPSRLTGSSKVGPSVGDVPRLRLTTFEENCLGGQFIRFFYDCEDFAYITFRGKKCTTIEALLLCGYLFYGDHVYQANSVVLLLFARVLPRKVIRTFNILLIRWRIDPHEGTLTHALSCSWYGASEERFRISEATPVA